MRTARARPAGRGAHHQEAPLAAAKHTLVVLDPGHFHAALSLRKPHPRLDDDIHVFAEDGPDVEAFLAIVDSFNQRPQDPTRWKLHVHRGPDPLARLRAQRPGDVVIIAGRNDRKMHWIASLHADGFHVLGDKPWLIDAAQLPQLHAATAGPPLAMDIMTERHDVATRLQKALMARPEIFGTLRTGGDEPAIHLCSVHHLYKLVNGKPLVRPAWYFDTAAQGEGMTDVNTHLVDLSQWMTGGDEPFDYARDVVLVHARQWPTAVPRAMFSRITGLEDFPAALQRSVVGDALQYLCNAEVSYRLRGVPARIESLWHLAIPEGGGDTHYALVRGTRADLVIEQGPATGFVAQLGVRPMQPGPQLAHRLSAALNELQGAFPGVAMKAEADLLRVAIPAALRTTHEEHFAEVLDEFLRFVDGNPIPRHLLPNLVAKYTLLVRAAELSHRTA
jgi:predicted dehydrogenase